MKPGEKPDRAILWKMARKPKPKNENDLPGIEDDEVDNEDDEVDNEDNEVNNEDDEEGSETLSSVFSKIVRIDIYFSASIFSRYLPNICQILKHDLSLFLFF